MMKPFSGLVSPACADASIPVRAPLRAYGASLLSLGARRLVRLACLVALGALVEGLGIALLIPLASLLFGGGSPPALFAHFTHMPVPFDMEDRSVLLVLCVAAFTLLLTVRALILWRRDRALNRLSTDLVDLWRARLAWALAAADWPVLNGLRRAEVDFALTGDVARLAVGGERMLRGSVAIIQLAVLATIAVRLSAPLSLFTALLLVPALLLARRINAQALRHGAEMTGKGGARHRAFADFLAGMKLAKAHNAETAYAERFIAASDNLRQQSQVFANAQLRATYGMQAAAAALGGGVLLIGSILLQLPAALLSAMLVMLSRLIGPVQQISSGIQAILSMLPAVENLTSLEADLMRGRTSQSVRSRPSATGPAALALRKVCHSHDGARGTVLHEVDLELAAGDLAVLTGASGAGKTTLADLLIGLLAPDAGTLLVDGHAVAGERARAEWREEIAYIPQDPFLFDCSLRDNLLWASPHTNEDELWTALDIAQAAGFVRSLPQGLDTRVGERGSLLSGGERQRVCLARALLRRPRFLVMDEATNALDPSVEARLHAALEPLRGKVTVLLIAHRLPEDLQPARRFELTRGRLCPTV